MKLKHWILTVIAVIALLLSIYLTNRNIPHDGGWGNLASVFFAVKPKTSDLISKYKTVDRNIFPIDPKKIPKIKVLIVPGHEPNFGGTEYSGLKERELNVVLAKRLFSYLDLDRHFDVKLARDDKEWAPEIQNYFTNKWDEINVWRKLMNSQMIALSQTGKVKIITDGPAHGVAPSASATKLYGINKWASENNYDLVLHVHFNDNPKIAGKPKFKGFVIYVPEKQYSNSEASVALGKDLMIELSKIASTSNHLQEKDGVVEDQDLIAIGRYNTLDSLGVLIEYAYIYEPLMLNPKTRDEYITNMASSTYAGLVNFFESRLNSTKTLKSN